MSGQLVQLVAYRDWIIGVICQGDSVYLCWVITPEAIALNDGERYPSESDAMGVGRSLVSWSAE